MATNDLDWFKKCLLELRAKMIGNVSHMADSALGQSRSDSDLSSMPIHMADVGNDNFDREFTLQLLQSGHATLKEIDEALQRIEEGTFGICEECGGKISKKRLEVLPYATLCIKCAEKEEDG